MRRVARMFPIGLMLVALGCGPALDAPVDPDGAAALLRSALEAWKQGEAYAELPRRQPPIYFNERAWEAGTMLIRYELGKADRLGRQGRCTARLVLKDRQGKVTERRVSYLIDTTPRVVIVRENLGL